MSIRLIKTLFAALMMLPLVAWPAASGDAGTCYTIGDMDARSYCLAKARKDAGMCYSIQRADLRAQCLAEVR